MPWDDDDFVALPANPVKFTLRSTQEDLDRGELSMDLEFTPIPDRVIADASTKIARAIDQKLTRALIGFHSREGRWPAWAWVEDWRTRAAYCGMSLEVPDHELAAVPIPDVHCGDVCPYEAYTTTTYQSGILNDRPDLAVEFFRRAAALEGLNIE
jgi:hypothetical protein